MGASVVGVEPDAPLGLRVDALLAGVRRQHLVLGVQLVDPVAGVERGKLVVGVKQVVGGRERVRGVRVDRVAADGRTHEAVPVAPFERRTRDVGVPPVRLGEPETAATVARPEHVQELPAGELGDADGLRERHDADEVRDGHITREGGPVTDAAGVLEADVGVGGPPVGVGHEVPDAGLPSKSVRSVRSMGV